jgi:membrane protein implicated in regulation of membrane protease activity
MENFATIVLLLTALALPVVLFLLFRPRSRLSALGAAAVAVAAGWSFNVACIFATEAIAAKEPSQVDGSSLSIAVAYGWACPLALVLVTWLVWHFVTRRKRDDHSSKQPPLRGAA